MNWLWRWLGLDFNPPLVEPSAVPAPPPPPARPWSPETAYFHPMQGYGVRRAMELVGVLHRRGYGRLRLSCHLENAGPAPVWFGDIAPVTYFRRDHGAILARHPFPDKVEEAERRITPNDWPMFSERRLARPDYPWPGYHRQTAEEAAESWLGLYPGLAAEGLRDDPAYTDWYARMLAATAPTGLVMVSRYLEPPPGYMYVSCGPPGVDRFELPPPGEAPPEPRR